MLFSTNLQRLGARLLGSRVLGLSILSPVCVIKSRSVAALVF